MLSLANKSLLFFCFVSPTLFAEKNEFVDRAEFVKQLRSYCESDQYWSAKYKVVGGVQGSQALDASLIWKCPYKVALRVEGPNGLEFIFNGSEAWFFYPARALGKSAVEQNLNKVEHYTSLENRLLGLWIDLWRNPSVESRQNRRLEESYQFKMKVVSQNQIFVFEPKKAGFPKLELGFSVLTQNKVPELLSFESKSMGTYVSSLEKDSVQKKSLAEAVVFNPQMPSAKVNVQVPKLKN